MKESKSWTKIEHDKFFKRIVVGSTVHYAKENNSMSKKVTYPVMAQSKAYCQAHAYFNKFLFNDTLGKMMSTPMLIFSRDASTTGGHFSPSKWYDDKGNLCHEIAINAQTMDSEDVPGLLQVLIHEMLHQWQHEHGTPGRGGYHNKEFAELARDIGLQPNGNDGKMTGDSVSTSLIDGDKAETAIVKMPQEYSFPWLSGPLNGFDGNGNDDEKDRKHDGKTKERESRSGKRVKYTCTACGFNVWGKHGGHIMCMTESCNRAMIGGGSE